MKDIYSSASYKKMPIPLQNVAVSILGAGYALERHGFAFARRRREITSFEVLPLARIKAFQLNKLYNLIEHCYSHVRYYHEKFDKIGFKPADLKCLEDLIKIPMLDKETIRQHQQDIISNHKNRAFLIKGHTSGTTGRSLELLMDNSLIQNEFAFADRQYRWAGGSAHGKKAILRDKIIVPAGQTEPPFWRYDAFSKHLIFSIYHISEENASAYFEKLQSFSPELIYAYPSALFAIGQILQRKGIRLNLPALKGIVTSSETLFNKCRTSIEHVFGAKIFDWYGLFERNIFIGTCEFGTYHVFPDYGVTEYLPAGINENGEKIFELVGTGFINKVMPLIRYRTGDYVTLYEQFHCSCGRSFPTIKTIVGRVNDVIITPDGRKIGMLDIAFEEPEIMCGQIIQDSLDHLTVLVVPVKGFSDQVKDKIVKKIRDRIEPSMAIEFKCVHEIPRTSTGKYRIMVSKL